MGWILIALLILIVIAVALVAAKRKSEGSVEVSDLPYVKQETLLTEAERSFLGVLEQAIGDRFRIYAQVRLADLLSVRAGTEKAKRAAAQNRINGKHADFVLCNPKTLEIVCAIELDDSSHQRASRKERDAFLEQVCATAGLPLARFPARSGYVVAEVRAEILALLGVKAEPVVTPESGCVAPAKVAVSQPSGEPACPKCGGETILRTVKSGAHAGKKLCETILRTVKSGAHAGKKLWGCKSYPVCKGYVPAGT